MTTPRRSARNAARQPDFDAGNQQAFVHDGPKAPAIQAWINKINREWPNLTASQRDAVGRHAARWGPNCDPRDTPGSTRATEVNREAWIRKRCFRSNYGIAKCHTCWTSNARMNLAYDQIPIGLDDFDIMPCGHAWKNAMIELWLIAIEAHRETYDDGSASANRIKPVPTEMRRVVRRMLGVMLGGDENVTWTALSDRAEFGRRVRAHPADLIEFPNGRPAQGPQWPDIPSP